MTNSCVNIVYVTRTFVIIPSNQSRPKTSVLTLKSAKSALSVWLGKYLYSYSVQKWSHILWIMDQIINCGVIGIKKLFVGAFPKHYPRLASQTMHHRQVLNFVILFSKSNGWKRAASRSGRFGLPTQQDHTIPNALGINRLQGRWKLLLVRTG